jgi:hypothetical protein
MSAFSFIPLQTGSWENTWSRPEVQPPSSLRVTFHIVSPCSPTISPVPLLSLLSKQGLTQRMAGQAAYPQGT